MSKRISIIGSGNWGSTIGKIVGHNVRKFDDFQNEVRMWTFEEMIDGRKLTEIINQTHENVKYLPNIKLPDNLIAEPDVTKCTEDADLIIFVLPHQFLSKVMVQMKSVIKPTAYGVSLIKGLDVGGDHGIRLLTDSIRNELNIGCAVLMGANLANEVSMEYYCEATIACKDSEIGAIFKRLFQTDYFRITHIKDEVGAELCGALKNIVAVGAGITVGLGFGDNTKAAVIRLGFMEMRKFIFHFFASRNPEEMTFLESCGVADLITTCYGGRNQKIGFHLATTEKSVAELEKELLNGQSAQGPLTAAEVNEMLEAKGIKDQYPLLSAIHEICMRRLPAKKFIDCLRNHPEHM